MNGHNQAPHLTQDTNLKMTTSQLDITNESQKVSPFPAVDHKASINRRARKHNKNKTEITTIVASCYIIDKSFHPVVLYETISIAYS